MNESAFSQIPLAFSVLVVGTLNLNLGLPLRHPDFDMFLVHFQNL
jgi:hypothetical protein